MLSLGTKSAGLHHESTLMFFRRLLLISAQLLPVSMGPMYLSIPKCSWRAYNKSSFPLSPAPFVIVNNSPPSDDTADAVAASNKSLIGFFIMVSTRDSFVDPSSSASCLSYCSTAQAENFFHQENFSSATILFDHCCAENFES